MHLLKDGCALIFSGVSLYDGLSSQNGMIAVYGKGVFANTLYKYGETSVTNNVRYSNSSGSGVNYSQLETSDQKIFTSICVPKDLGVQGIEDYLEDRGFKQSDYENEYEASKSFSYERQGGPKITLDGEDKLSKSTVTGRKIAASISMSQSRVIGKHSCVTTKRNQASIVLNLDDPIDMGNLKLIAKKHTSIDQQALVYINGMLRLLTSTGKPVEPFNEMIWSIYPKLEDPRNSGRMERGILDDVLYREFLNDEPSLRQNIHQNVLLGCYNN